MTPHVDWQVAAQVTGTATTIVVAIAGYLSGPGALRSRLSNDVDLLTKIPDGSAAHDRLLAHIDHQVETIEALDKNARRDITGAVVAGLMALGLGWLALYLFDLEWKIWNWIWDAAGVFALVCAAACLSLMFEALQRVPRDEKDKPIE